MALAEVGGSLPWCCPALVLLAPGYWSLFLNLIFFSWMMDLGNRPGIRAKYWQLQKKSTYPQLEWYSKDRKLFENVVLRYAIWIWIYEKLREITQDACIMSKCSFCVTFDFRFSKVTQNYISTYCADEKGFANFN